MVTVVSGTDDHLSVNLDRVDFEIESLTGNVVLATNRFCWHLQTLEEGESRGCLRRSIGTAPVLAIYERHIDEPPCHPRARSRLSYEEN